MSQLAPLSTRPKPVDDDVFWQNLRLKHEQDASFFLLDGLIVHSNLAALRLLRADESQQLLGMMPSAFLQDPTLNDQQLFQKRLVKDLLGAGPLYCLCRTLDEQLIEVEVRSQGFIDNARSIMHLTVRDLNFHPFSATAKLKPEAKIITQNVFGQANEALHHEREILEMIAQDKPLVHILEDVCDRMERLLDNGSLCAIILYDADKGSLNLGAAPSLPEEYFQELEKQGKGLHSGSCGEAMASKQLSIVEDIASNPLWGNCRELALSHDLLSCWSLPIKTAFNTILGTIDVYHRTPHTPSKDEQALMIDVSALVALAIDKKNMERSLEESEERYRAVVTNLTEGIMVLASQGQILTCNPSAQRILKISDCNAVGRRHRYFKRIISEDGATIDIRNDPASLVFRSGHPIFNLSIGLELEDHTVVWLLVNVLPINEANSSLTSAVLISFTDTTEVRETQRQLQYIAAHDALTGLPNRHQLSQRLAQALANAQHQQKKIALLFLDLDRFKNVNDTAGHAAGDTLLCDVATRLSSCIRTSDMLARLGGDEFVIVAEEFDSALHLKDLAERVLARMREPFLIDGNEYHLGTSIGISVYPHDAADGSTLLRCADSAMYLAKESGRNNYQFFTTELNVRAQHRYALEKNLRRALSEQEFLVFYQPKVCLKTSCIVGAEALIRWQMPDVGIIPPDEFIPISEEIGLILPIGRWILEQACLQAKLWRDKFSPDFVISVNISPKQFQDPGLFNFIQQVLNETKLPGQGLQLEITEGLLMGELDLLLPVFNAIKKLGVSISLDDFGTGFSSLSYLQRFPIDNLKIDRSFIRDIPEKQDSVVLTRAIIAMANALGLSVTAEGVEKTEQLRFLTDSGCQEMQGFLFSKPLSANDFENLLINHTPK
ncbi:sensor domain-containing phosphodiesterase [Undibacterium sp. Ren11W]|uniref:sensor domain-containing phosphodiesterase n=1 Tax=Undibacterium sp. Ren11W TaxID=3413045 RepID=UPI003BF4431C